MLICGIALDSLFEDTKALVADGVRKDIAHRIAIAQSQTDTDVASSRGALRESCLQSWMKLPSPLAYSCDGCTDSFTLLVKAIAPDEQSEYYGLPNCKENTTSPNDFAKSLFDMSKPASPSRPKAPVQANGSFLPVLQVAHKALISLQTEADAPTQYTFFVNVFSRALRHFKVNFFPSTQPSPHSVGSPYRVPVYNSWGNLGGPNKLQQLTLASQSSQPSISPTTVALNKAIASDCNAEWSANTLCLTTLHTVLNKTSLPMDFKPPTQATGDDVAYVNDTFDWIKECYDGTKPLHHLALLVAIITASSLLPKLFMPKGSKSLFSDSNSKQDVREIYNNMDWIKKDKKGMSDKGIFIAMFTALTISIYEENSPLRQHMVDMRRHGLGDPWTKKYCQFCLFSYIVFYLILFHLNFLAVKGVTYGNLIRLGLLWGKGTGAYDKGSFESAWGCHSDSYILKLYNSLCRKVKGGPFGPFDSLSLLIGDRNARIFCIDLKYCYRPASQPITSSNFQVNLLDNMDKDIEMDEDI